MKAGTRSVIAMMVMAIATQVFAGGKVLLVHSYHAGYPWVDAITEGVEAGVKDSGLELEIFYMDTKRKTSDEWKKQAGELAKAKVDQYKPDVIIAVDDNAQQFFAKDLAGAGNPQVVFCGVNAEASKYNYPADNITGILERPHFAQTVKFLKAFAPGIAKVAVLSDKSPTTEGFYESMKKEKLDAEVVAWETPVTFDDWKKAVADLAAKADAIAIVQYHTVKKTAEKDSESMDPVEVMTWTVANCPKPIIAVQAFGVADGAVCGIVESGQEHGYESAVRAVAMCNDGKTAKDFPVTTAKKGLVMLNAKTAEAKKLKVPFALFKSADKVYEK